MNLDYIGKYLAVCETGSLKVEPIEGFEWMKVVSDNYGLLEPQVEQMLRNTKLNGQIKIFVHRNLRYVAISNGTQSIAVKL